MGFTDFTSALRHRAVRRTWLSQIISLVGDTTAWVGANVLVFQNTHSSFDIAVLNALTFAAWLGPAQVLTAGLARLPRVPVMIATDLIRALLFLVMVIPGMPLLGFLALYFVAMCNAPVFECTRSALMVDITPPEELSPALSLMNSTSQAGALLGFACGGVMVALIAPRQLLVVNAVTFLVSALLLAGLRVPATQPVAGPPGAARRGTSTSLRNAARSLREPVVLRCVVLVVLMCLATSASESITVVFATEQLHAQATAWVGVLAAAMPAGALLGIALMRHRQSGSGLMRTSVLVCLVGSAATALLAPAARWVALGVVLYALVGTMGLIMGPTSTLVTPRLPLRERAAAWSVLRGLVRGGELVGALAAGVLATRVSPGVALSVCCVPIAVAAATFALRPLPARRYAAVETAPAEPAVSMESMAPVS
jgi:predicted MFS family arabinose efflux permease